MGIVANNVVASRPPASATARANFSFLVCLEVAEKFGVVVWGGVEYVATVSNLNPS